MIYASGQDLIEKISEHICNCIDTIENMDSLQAKLDRCASETLEIYFTSDDSDDDNEFADDNDTLSRTMDAVIPKLGYYCPKIRKFLLADKENHFYKRSDSEAANDSYQKGYEALKSEDFKNAEKYYNEAIKADPFFVFAYDDLALTYRKSGDYKKAIKFYDKSIEIYPEGSYALQNQAVAYTYLKDYSSALYNYEQLMKLYPDNPEGFYGAAKIYFLKEEFETALDYAFYVHKMYVTLKSDYVKDTEDLIQSIYAKMKEQNKLDIFNRKAEEHGIKLN
jgi:tetratricopeptide (TPR) repeat protein